VLFAFDLLELDGEDLRPMPIEARKHKLAQLVRNVGSGLHLCEHLHGEGMEIFEHACSLGCEGIVSKRAGSRYVSGRTDNGRRRAWINTLLIRSAMEGPPSSLKHAGSSTP
jgi:ATP-dependent DNA ligase